MTTTKKKGPITTTAQGPWEATKVLVYDFPVHGIFEVKESHRRLRDEFQNVSLKSFTYQQLLKGGEIETVTLPDLKYVKADPKKVEPDAPYSVRLPATLRSDAEAVLDRIGMTLPAFLKVALTYAVANPGNPMDFLRPNETTLAAIRESKEGKLNSASSIDDLMSQLNADD